MRASQLFLSPKISGTAQPRAGITRLMIEGGYIRQISDGIMAYLPLGMLVLRNLVQITQTELKKIGAQEVLLPVLNPEEFWKGSEKIEKSGEEIFEIETKSGERLVVAPSHDETVFYLCREMLHESWQLPAFFFQVQISAKDAAHKVSSGSGILYPRETVLIDGFSLHRSYSELNNFVPKAHRAFTRTLNQCGLRPLVAEGVPNTAGSDRTYDFVVLVKGGDYKVVTCDGCGYVADQNIALGLAKTSYSKPLPLEFVYREEVTDFAALPDVLGLPDTQFAACELYRSEDGIVMAVARKDQKVSKAKIEKLLGIPILGALSEDQCMELGLPWGFVSPLGFDPNRYGELKLRIAIDTTIAETSNLVMAANERSSWVRNANFGRDFEGDAVGDICMVDGKSRCFHCGSVLRIQPALRVARLVKLNSDNSKARGISVKDPEGEPLYPWMGFCEINLDRVMAAVAWRFQDRRGLLWPLQLAPYKAALIVVGRSARLHSIAKEIHASMPELLLWDDRPMSFLSKAEEADRIGVPLRIIISHTTHRDSMVTLLYRLLGSSQRIPINKIKASILELWKKERQAAGVLGDQ